MARSVTGRLAALEDHVEGRVEERMRREIEAVLDLLERRLSQEEFARVARIIVEEARGEGGE